MIRCTAQNLHTATKYKSIIIHTMHQISGRLTSLHCPDIFHKPHQNTVHCVQQIHMISCPSGLYRHREQLERTNSSVPCYPVFSLHLLPPASTMFCLLLFSLQPPRLQTPRPTALWHVLPAAINLSPSPISPFPSSHRKDPFNLL